MRPVTMTARHSRTREPDPERRADAPVAEEIEDHLHPRVLEAAQTSGGGGTRSVVELDQADDEEKAGGEPRRAGIARRGGAEQGAGPRTGRCGSQQEEQDAGAGGNDEDVTMAVRQVAAQADAPARAIRTVAA
jgi:hypothetical protein